MNPRHDSKVALVTGASRGIGRAIALELARSGYDLVLTARDREALEATAAAIRDTGRKSALHLADLTAAGAPDELADFAARQFGRVDVLVNNAGGAPRGDFFQLTDAQWRSGFDLKFFAQIGLCRAVWPHLKATGGSIVAIAGIGGRAPVADYMIGSSVIGAQLAFMKALADIGTRDGVQVNSVNPGSVDTDRLRHRLRIVMRATGLDEASALEHHRQELRITRFGMPDDIAGLVAFMVSERGRWLHGTAIDMDGGQVDPLRMSKYD